MLPQNLETPSKKAERTVKSLPAERNLAFPSERWVIQTDDPMPF